MLTYDAGALPVLIQGGMGVAVSSWPLARAVAATGQLGVVSGTALDVVLARRLQDGDPGGHARAAMAASPVPGVAACVLDRYFRAGGREAGTPYAPVPRLRLRQGRHAQELAVVASFAEVWLARQGHHGPVGVNFLEKIQMATPAAAYGAMLAGVDVVLVGAGIPRELPRLLGALARHEPVSLPVDVLGASDGQRHTVDLDPVALLGKALPPLRRPAFLAIVSAHVLAEYLARDPGIRPDGFVIEGPLAGGHNAPPRGRLTMDDDGYQRAAACEDKRPVSAQPGQARESGPRRLAAQPRKELMTACSPARSGSAHSQFCISRRLQRLSPSDLGHSRLRLYDSRRCHKERPSYLLVASNSSYWFYPEGS
jgi:NAD(P)H-dependent flavin oxidoreductase YrpB (nitropropane dioxygenase family)